MKLQTVLLCRRDRKYSIKWRENFIEEWQFPYPLEAKHHITAEKRSQVIYKPLDWQKTAPQNINIKNEIKLIILALHMVKPTSHDIFVRFQPRAKDGLKFQNLSPNFHPPTTGQKPTIRAENPMNRHFDNRIPAKPWQIRLKLWENRPRMINYRPIPIHR